MSKAHALSSLAAFALAGVLLYFSLRGIEWGRVWQILRTANPRPIALAFAFACTALFARAMRWRVLLGAEAHIDVSSAFWATAAGYFGNSFLPARAGELVRTLMISSRSTLTKSFVLTTALAERVADAIALVIISAVVLLTLPAQPGWIANASKPFAILGAFGVLCIAVLPYLEGMGKALLRRAPIPEGIHAKVLHVFEQGLLGIRAFHDARRLAVFLALTLAIWCIDASVTVIGARALGLTIALPIAFLLIAGLGLGSALPSTPGYVGIFQFVAVSVLVPFGFSRTDAIAYILFAQALSYVQITLLGGLGFWRYRRARP
jgi:uncharacterized protein (TIRG00374 family)